MPTRTSPKQGGSFLTRKVGPAPVWVWAVSVIGLYLAYRFYSGRTATVPAQTTTQAPTDQTGAGVSGGGGSFTGTPTDTSGVLGGASAPLGVESAFTAYSDLLSQLESQNAQLTSGLLQGGLPGSVPAAGTPAASSTPTVASFGPAAETGPAAPISAPAPSASSAPAPSVLAHFPIAAANPDFSGAASAATAAYQQVGKPMPFGGVVSTRTLANGASLTTYASGRQVEQVPGKSAYVVRR